LKGGGKQRATLSDKLQFVVDLQFTQPEATN
jgi:hypothetical protein